MAEFLYWDHPATSFPGLAGYSQFKFIEAVKLLHASDDKEAPGPHFCKQIIQSFSE